MENDKKPVGQVLSEVSDKGLLEYKLKMNESHIEWLSSQLKIKDEQIASYLNLMEIILKKYLALLDKTNLPMTQDSPTESKTETT